MLLIKKMFVCTIDMFLTFFLWTCYLFCKRSKTILFDRKITNGNFCWIIEHFPSASTMAIADCCRVISYQITKKIFFNPVSPKWLIFGTSVAWHVCMKLAKLFEPIQNGFLEICPIELAYSGGFTTLAGP